MANWDPEWVQAVVALGALAAAIVAGVISWQAYKRSYRPIIRVVPIFDDETAEMIMNRLILKNFGSGPAIAIVIVSEPGASDDDLFGELDALEPLGETYGPKFKESSRVGRREVLLDDQLVEDHKYRVWYTDTALGWHETSFRVSAREAAFFCAPSRSVNMLEVPEWVQKRSQRVGGWD